MKLKAMFSAVAPEQFKPSTRQAMNQVLELINSNIKSLVDAEKYQGVEFEDFFQIFDVIDLRRLNDLIQTTRVNVDAKSAHAVNFRNVMGALDVQAAWLLDGGNLTTYLSYLRSNNTLNLHELTNLGALCGMHHLLFRIGYSDSSLSLKGLDALLEVVDAREHQQVQDFDESQLARVSLLGCFTPKPQASELLASSAEQYLKYFYPRSLNHPGDESISAVPMVNSAVLEFKRLRNQWWSQLDFLLRVLIYNTGLRLKLEGHNTESIIQRLNPVLDAVVDSCICEPGVELTALQAQVFRKQVWRNLFSPFPDCLAELGTTTADLLGLPGFTEGSWNSLTLSTVEGPLAVFSANFPQTGKAHVLFEGIENAGIDVDLNLVLQGALRYWDDLPELVKLKGSCTLLNDAYAAVIETGPDASAHEFLNQFVNHVDIAALSRDARLGHLIVRFEEARLAFLQGALLYGNDSDCPAEYLKSNPDQNEIFLQYLVKHNRLEGRILTWCGYDSGIFDKLGNQVSENLKASMLESDLGL